MTLDLFVGAVLGGLVGLAVGLSWDCERGRDLRAQAEAVARLRRDEYRLERQEPDAGVVARMRARA